MTWFCQSNLQLNCAKMKNRISSEQSRKRVIRESEVTKPLKHTSMRNPHWSSTKNTQLGIIYQESVIDLMNGLLTPQTLFFTKKDAIKGNSWNVRQTYHYFLICTFGLVLNFFKKFIPKVAKKSAFLSIIDPSIVSFLSIVLYINKSQEILNCTVP